MNWLLLGTVLTMALRITYVRGYNRAIREWRIHDERRWEGPGVSQQKD